MNDTMNEQEKTRLEARLAYIRELASVQAEQLEKSMLEIADLTKKLGVIDADKVELLRSMASMVAIIKGLKGE